jgi:glycerol-3-phosphate acyltransferase PlsY
MNLIVAMVAIIGYFIGAIPTGYIIARLKGIEDIRKYGSGNTGATNASRVLGRFYFFLIFFLDAGKAFIFVSAAKLVFPVVYLYCFAFCLLIGNAYSPFLPENKQVQGSGGKGVSSLFGLLLAIDTWATLFLFIAWLLFLAFTKVVGIASVAAALSLPVYAILFSHLRLFWLFSVGVALWIVWTHRSNIRNYWNKCCVK